VQAADPDGHQPKILKEGAMANQLPEWMRDLVQNVDDRLVRDIVNDFRSYDPGPSMGQAAKVIPVDAGKVVTGTDGPAHTPHRGWQESPRVDSWRPPGEAVMNALLDQQDALDKAKRIRKLAEAAAVRRAEAELLKEREEERKPKDKK
jgi:hypothetical protein